MRRVKEVGEIIETAQVLMKNGGDEEAAEKLGAVLNDHRNGNCAQRKRIHQILQGIANRRDSKKKENEVKKIVLMIGEEIKETGYCVSCISRGTGNSISVDIEPVGSISIYRERPLLKGESRGYCFIPGQTMKIGGRNVTLKYANKNQACFEIFGISKK